MSAGTDVPGALDAVLALTREMVARADSGDWEGLAELQKDRDARLRRACAEGPPTDPATLTELRDLNDRVLRTTAEQREALGEALRYRNRGRKAHAAYARSGA